MKTLKLLIVFISVTAISFSCIMDIVNNNEGDSEDETTLEISNKTISAKWIVSNEKSRYKSFEFSEDGNYIVVENPTTKSTNGGAVHVGTYEILLGLEMSIELQDFGILEELVFGSTSASFTVIPTSEPTKKIAVETEIAEEINESAKTKLLSKSWMYSRSTWYDAKDGTTSDVEIPEGFRVVAAITYYGTYTSFQIVGDQSERFYGNWMWADNSETSIKYWAQDESFGNAQVAKIATLNKNELVLVLNTPDGDIITEYWIPEPTGRYW